MMMMIMMMTSMQRRGLVASRPLLLLAITNTITNRYKRYAIEQEEERGHNTRRGEVGGR